MEKDKENREAAKQQAKGFAKSSQAASREESKAAAKIGARFTEAVHARSEKSGRPGQGDCRTSRNSPTPTRAGSRWSRRASERRCII